MSNFPHTPVRRIVIAGGGTAGWMAAAALSRLLGKTHEIKLVESEEIGTIGVGEATIPTLMTFHRLLDIDEAEFMAASQGTIKLGISFENWLEKGHRYIHSFGTSGRDHWTAGFQQFWLRGRQLGIAGGYEDYCVELAASLQDKFGHLPRNGINYAYHFDAYYYARFMRNIAERHGLQRIEGKIVEVQTDAANGFISGLRLADGALVEGDFFLDCTGFRALLIGKALNIGFEDWSHWLFNDSALATQTTAVRDAVPYTRAIAGTAGWQWRIPLQHRVGNGIVYSSRYISDEEAKQEFMSSLEGEIIREPFPIRFRPGQRMKSWHKNCVAIGLSGSFIEPLESTTIHLIQRGIVHLLQLFPAAVTESAIHRYNHKLSAELTHVRDFVVLHYWLTKRRDTPYWRAVAQMDIPASLRQRIELFRETGTVFRDDEELFADNSWVQVMLGQGVMPERHHPTPNLMSENELRSFLDEIAQHTRNTVSKLPSHMDYMRSFAPAKVPEQLAKR